MDDLQLSRFEQDMVDLASERYQQSFFRWGHLLGWLSLPLLILACTKTFWPYAMWISTAATLLMFEWYFVVTTRVIGKLASTSAKSLPELEPPAPVKRPLRPRIYSLFAYIALLPAAALIAVLDSDGRFGTPRWLSDMYAADVLLGGAIGFFCLLIPMIIYWCQKLAGENPPTTGRWMAFGASMLLWAMIFLLIWGMGTGVKPGK